MFFNTDVHALPKAASSDAILAQIAGFFGLHGALFIGEPVAGSEESFSVDADELMQAVDTAVARARVRPARSLLH